MTQAKIMLIAVGVILFGAIGLAIHTFPSIGSVPVQVKEEQEPPNLKRDAFYAKYAEEWKPRTYTPPYTNTQRRRDRMIRREEQQFYDRLYQEGLGAYNELPNKEDLDKQIHKAFLEGRRKGLW